MLVSIPEATAIDLVRYPEHAGFLSNVATFLRELGEPIDRRGLLRVATADGETAYAQRLGYLLDLVGPSTEAEPLAEWIGACAPRVTPLTPGLPITGMPRKLRWRLAVNDQVEADEGMA